MISFWLSVVRLLKAVVRAWKDELFRAALGLAVMILVSGTIFYSTVEGWSLVDALFYSVMTISTIGASGLTPQTDFGKIFTIVYIFAGIGVFVAMFGMLGRALLTDRDDKTNQ